MNARRTKRRKKTAAARLRPFWFLFALVALLAAGAGYWAATWPGFFPSRITVTGNRTVPSQTIIDRARIEPRANLWLQNMRAAAARIAQIPYVKDARVHRSLPALVRLEVTERIPYAVVRFGGRSVVVDRDLRVLETGEGADALPVFALKGQAVPIPGVFLKDPQAARLRDDDELLAAEHVAAAGLRYDRFGDLIVTMRSGVQLLLGDDTGLAQKAALVGPILSQVAAQGRRIAAVDLRAPKTPVVVYK